MRFASSQKPRCRSDARSIAVRPPSPSATRRPAPASVGDTSAPGSPRRATTRSSGASARCRCVERRRSYSRATSSSPALRIERGQIGLEARRGGRVAGEIERDGARYPDPAQRAAVGTEDLDVLLVLLEHGSPPAAGLAAIGPARDRRRRGRRPDPRHRRRVLPEDLHAPEDVARVVARVLSVGQREWLLPAGRARPGVRGDQVARGDSLARPVTALRHAETEPVHLGRDVVRVHPERGALPSPRVVRERDRERGERDAVAPASRERVREARIHALVAGGAPVLRDGSAR